MQLPTIAIIGPTCCHKTEVSLRLSASLPCEIISVDSVMVYRGLDIGSAKPKQAEQQQVPHHLISICDPADTYSAAAFIKDAWTLVDDIKARGAIPLLVGGSIFYFVMLDTRHDVLAGSDQQTRRQLDQQEAQDGLAALYQELLAVDPQRAAELHENDAYRIKRALEIYRLTGKPASAWAQKTNPANQDEELTPLHKASARTQTTNPTNQDEELTPLHKASARTQTTNPTNQDEELTPSHKIGARTQTTNPANRISARFCLHYINRQTLHAKIEERLDGMFARGFIEEVCALMARGDLNLSMPALRAVGYRQLWEYLQGKYNYQDMRARIVAANRQLLKHQTTWLKRIPDLHYYALDEQPAAAVATKIANRIQSMIE